jgi:hypothetical protein
MLSRTSMALRGWTHLPRHSDLSPQQLLLAVLDIVSLAYAITCPLLQPSFTVPPLLFYRRLPLLNGGKSLLPSLLPEDLPPEQLSLPVCLWSHGRLEKLRRWLELYVHDCWGDSPAVTTIAGGIGG